MMRKMKSWCRRNNEENEKICAFKEGGDVEKNEQEKQGDDVENEVVDGKGKKEEGEENDEGKEDDDEENEEVGNNLRISAKLHVHVLT